MEVGNRRPVTTRAIAVPAARGRGPAALVGLLALVAALWLTLVAAPPASATAIGPGVGELADGPDATGPATPGADEGAVGDLIADGTDERILDYRVDYRLQPDGTLLGKETINYQFPDGGKRRGIFVSWPIRRPISGEEDKYRLYDLQVTGVSSPTGAPTEHEVDDQGESRVLRIGDPDRFVDGRLQTYVIDYTVKGTVNGFADHQEFYVNAIGFDSKFPIDKATVTFQAPQAGQQFGCWAGGDGIAAPEGQPPATVDCTATPGNPATFSAQGLQPAQGVTIAAWLPAGTVSNDAPVIRTGAAADGGGLGESLPEPVARGISLGSYALGGLIPLLAALFMGLLVHRRGRDERYAGLTPGLAPADGAEGEVVRGGAGPIAVRFQPPDDAPPGLVGTIIDESADTRDVSATVVDLAVRGYLTIEEIDTGRRSKADWELRRTDPAPTEPLLRYERTVYDGIFASGDVVRLSDLRNQFSTTLALAKKQMYREVVDRQWFRQSPEATRTAWAGMAVALAIVGGIVLFFAGMASVSIDNAAGIGVVVPSGVVLGGGLLVAAAIVYVLGLRMPARTATGSAIHAQTLGFRQYLETAEANQIRFEEAQSIFSRYLPYAIVFGCAERWAEVFHDVAEAAAAQGYALDMPTWYLFYGMSGGFPDFGSVATSMEDFATASVGTFAATPGSSGNSAFGGGSGGGFGGGGGFSGGGGFGGGSVGSW